MRPNDWQLTDDVDTFLARAGDFLRSRPALHTVPLTVTDALRAEGPGVYGPEAPVFGWLERAGEVRAAFFRTPPFPLVVTPLTPGDADAFAARLVGLGRAVPGVNADRETADAFAAAWQRHSGAAPALREQLRLYRLGTLTPPAPAPAGRARVAGERDEEHLMAWAGEFAAATGEPAPADARSWAASRIASGRVTYWEAPDGTPVSMAGTTPLVAGQIRVAPVYTPAPLRGRGYAGAATAEVSRAALAAGAREVLLFADLANPTSNGLYLRIGYVPVADFAVYAFGAPTP
ncbi:GNAT family N-acetyltransferase [Streptomyces sp. SL13]|uniref:GNAT family N-acetyltransferase n=1 Tax=Streptantibioticus silvisoli TaxID=2705255 RepID=A0AA90K1W3_9ACTN|nr:GNAT family N-acetyltransferase [Streptantibioticus silvisoli]MDI5974156.1 GNAT family N-acetyltransferase [Streptantibioticus silvisoli]